MWSWIGVSWHWLQQGANANIVLVAVTTWYVILTRRIVKATARQAVAVMQPELALFSFNDRGKPDGKFVLVENTGDHPAVIRDIEKTCYVHGQRTLSHSDWYWLDAVIAPKQNKVFDYGFEHRLKERGIAEFMCAYRFSIVVSDLSRQVVSRYEYYPGTRQFVCKQGMPWRVKLRQLGWHFKWRYHRAKPLIGKFKRWAEWENSTARQLPESSHDNAPNTARPRD